MKNKTNEQTIYVVMYDTGSQGNRMTYNHSAYQSELEATKSIQKLYKEIVLSHKKRSEIEDRIEEYSSAYNPTDKMPNSDKTYAEEISDLYDELELDELLMYEEFDFDDNEIWVKPITYITNN